MPQATDVPRESATSTPAPHAPLAHTYPARDCEWCGQAFTGRSRWQEVPGSGGDVYMHAGTGRLGDPDCVGEWREAEGMKAARGRPGIPDPDPSDAAAVWLDVAA